MRWGFYDIFEIGDCLFGLKIKVIEAITNTRVTMRGAIVGIDVVIMFNSGQDCPIESFGFA